MVSKKRYAEMAHQEMLFLKTIRDKDTTNPHREKIVQLYDDFKIDGENGNHYVMVFETLGPNLDKWLLKVSRLTKNIQMQEFYRQMEEVFRVHVSSK